jgi:hypothetical protein
MISIAWLQNEIEKFFPRKSEVVEEKLAIFLYKFYTELLNNKKESATESMQMQ